MRIITVSRRAGLVGYTGQSTGTIGSVIVVPCQCGNIRHTRDGGMGHFIYYDYRYKAFEQAANDASSCGEVGFLGGGGGSGLRLNK